MAGAGSLYDDLILHISPDKFFVESLTATAAVLVIDRISGEVSLQTKTGQIPVVASRKPLPGGGHTQGQDGRPTGQRGLACGRDGNHQLRAARTPPHSSRPTGSTPGCCSG